MSEMNDIIKNGQLMPADLTAQIRDKYYHVDVDPFTKSKRLFFDNSGGSFRRRTPAKLSAMSMTCPTAAATAVPLPIIWTACVFRPARISPRCSTPRAAASPPR